MPTSSSLRILTSILFLTQDHVASSVSRRRLCPGMQSFQKRDQGSRFRRTKILSVGRHVPAALNPLADKLVLRKSHGHTVQSRPPLPATFSKRMAVAALLHLKDQRT